MNFVCSICERQCDGATHCLVALPCGHMFGHACITKWLLSKLKCPFCNVETRLNDVIKLYANGAHDN